MEKMTPMVEQYYLIKERYPDAILLFRLGDFYEMFDEDAKIASSILNIALTSRQNLPMCGIPFHSAENYIKKLLEAGYKVAICEQLEDPSKAKGIVKRDVVRVITPGSYVESESPEEKTLIAVFYSEQDMASVALVNINKGYIGYVEGKRDRIISELSKFEISTLIIPEGERVEIGNRIFVDRLDRNLFKTGIAHFYLDSVSKKEAITQLREFPLSYITTGIALYYIREILLLPTDHILKIEPLKHTLESPLDSNAIRHLELIQNLRDGSRKYTLIEVLDKTETPQGKQLLKEIILNPLRDPKEITERLRAVEELMNLNVTPLLKGIGDLERIGVRVKMKLAKPKELINLRDSLKKILKIREVLSPAESRILREIREKLVVPVEVIELIDRSIEEDFNLSRIIKEGYSEILDEYRRIKENSEKLLAQFEEEERRKTGIPSLKVGYNRVFGYYIEVTKSHLHRVPKDYIRKQTLSQAERFTTERLKDLEEKILSAQGKIEEIEKELYNEVLYKISEFQDVISQTGRNIGFLDVLNSFSVVARERNYVKPTITSDGNIIIKDGRHPVVEAWSDEPFIPNDTVILKDRPIHIITGPNMSGKSTYIRQVALIVIMAQIGSFVPAKEAFITPVDMILTRIGTADYLARGLSTFMVEMTETANIILKATSNSLIILDEVGRGTSTYDGLSIAWATVEYIRNRIGAKTLFATHYHELTDLAEIFPEVLNYHVEVKEYRDRVIFTHKVKPGRITKSYGIYVAKLAGLPEEIIERAKEIMEKLEGKREMELAPLPLFENEIIARLKSINIKRMTPLEAYLILEELHKKITQRES